MNQEFLWKNKKRMAKDCPERLDINGGYFSTPGDVVFICNDGKFVECHSEILLSFSQVIRNIWRENSFMNISPFLSKEFKLFITLNFESSSLSSLLDMIYFQKKLVVKKDNRADVTDLLEALKISPSNFSTTENEDKVSEDDDSAIVDVISTLMDEFNVNPDQSENDLTEMLMTTLDESFLNEIDNPFEANTSLETLLIEPTDTESSKLDDEGNMDEVTTETDKSGSKKKVPPKQRKIRPTKPKPKVRECGVELENLSDKTLQHYYDILRNKSSSSNDTERQREEDNTDHNKRKRKANNSDFDNNAKKRAPKKPGGVEQSEVHSEAADDHHVVKKKGSKKPGSVSVDPGPKVPKKPGLVIDVQSEVPENALFLEKTISMKEPDDSIAIERTDQTHVIVYEDTNSCSQPRTSEADVQVTEVKQVRCQLCEDKFATRSKLLQHVSLAHCQSQLLQHYPFVRGDCALCVEQGRPKPLAIKSKQVHLVHVGQSHEKVLDLIPDAFKAVINLEFHIRKRNSRVRVKEEPIDDSLISVGSMDSFQDSFTKSLQSSTRVDQLQSSPRAKMSVFHDEDANHSFPAPAQQSSGVHCSLCPASEQVSFLQRAEMLSHLSCVHLASELVTLYSPPENGKCPFCPDSGLLEPFTEPQSYVNHIGSLHEKVLEILPAEFCARIDGMEKESRSLQKQNPDVSFDVSFESSLNSTVVGDGSNSFEADHLNSSISSSSGSNSRPESLGSIAKFIELSNKVSMPGPGTTVPPAEVRCRHCDVQFTSAEQRIQHIRAVHTRRREYNCRYCDQRFVDPNQYKLHLKAHKKDLIQQ